MQDYKKISVLTYVLWLLRKYHEETMNLAIKLLLRHFYVVHPVNSEFTEMVNIGFGTTSIR